MANQEPKLEGFGPEDAEKAEASGPNFHPSTVNHFLEAAISGVMPGGVKTEQPLFPKEYLQQFHSKYADWAPPPFDKLPPPAMPAIGPMPGGPMPGQSPAPLIRVMHVISGMDRMFSAAFTGQLSTLEPSFKAMRSRLWFGMPPMSDARWAAKGLDEEENIEEAMAVIQQAVDVFKHQLKPDVQGEMRTTHNKVWTEIDIFQDGIIAMRSQNGMPAPEFNIATLWQEYSKCHFQYMENQARAWVFKRLKILYQVWKDRTMRVMQSGREINATHVTMRIDHWALMILTTLLDLYVEAEIFLRTRTDGFSMINGIDARLIGAITLEKTERELNAIYAEMENKRVSALKGLLESVTAARTAARRAQAGPYPEFMEKPSLIFDWEFAMRSLMGEMDNPLSLVMESWVQSLADQNAERFGFVIYRTTHEQSEQEWKTFVETLEAALNDGWEGVLDPENIKPKATLHWIDGKEKSIPEGDIDAVRRDFKTATQSPFFPAGLTKTTCLAVNSASYKSFTAPNSKGDYRGFLVAIDADYDASASTQRKYKPGFKGSFNIIDQLVWTDLLALKASRAVQNAQEYWRLAAQHPWGVYVGPTTGVLRKKWRVMGDGAGALARSLARR